MSNTRKFFPLFNCYPILNGANIEYHYRTCVRKKHTDNQYFFTVVRIIDIDKCKAFKSLILKCYEILSGTVNPNIENWVICEDQTDEWERFHNDYREIIQLWQPEMNSDGQAVA